MQSSLYSITRIETRRVRETNAQIELVLARTLHNGINLAKLAIGFQHVTHHAMLIPVVTHCDTKRAVSQETKLTHAKIYLIAVSTARSRVK
jgi:hypothetical protein